jgi:hypothetical protein
MIVKSDYEALETKRAERAADKTPGGT